jgi:hypothetical protein
MAELKLSCQCGKVQGIAQNVSPQSGNHVICCCDDCQAFAHALKTATPILDEYGGTEIMQLPMSSVALTQGREHLACLRLKPKGLYRWYADCCDTPIGNTMHARMPFVGIIHNFIAADDKREQILGPVLAYWLPQFASSPPPITAKHYSKPRLLWRIATKLLGWKLSGKHQPSAFFDEQGKPRAKVNILSQ